MNLAVSSSSKARRYVGKVIRINVNTIVVEVLTKVKDSTYGKYVIKTQKFHAHMNTSNVSLGSEVMIVECRPYSKIKNFKLVEVLKLIA
jgi:small subunit ribosomal protein S17